MSAISPYICLDNVPSLRSVFLCKIKKPLQLSVERERERMCVDGGERRSAIADGVQGKILLVNS